MASDRGEKGGGEKHRLHSILRSYPRSLLCSPDSLHRSKGSRCLLCDMKLERYTASLRVTSLLADSKDQGSGKLTAIDHPQKSDGKRTALPPPTPRQLNPPPPLRNTCAAAPRMQLLHLSNSLRCSPARPKNNRLNSRGGAPSHASQSNLIHSAMRTTPPEKPQVHCSG